MTGREAVRLATSRLGAAGIEDPLGDARRLLCLALETTHFVLIDLDQPLSGNQLVTFEDALDRREDRTPMSHIIGCREFFGRSFFVSESVLDPRPDTETVIDVALRADFKRVLDLGTGSGCILATLLAERPAASGVGCDLSEDALRVAQRNLESLKVADRAKLIESDWFSAVSGKFDLIVSNPPYVSLEEMNSLQPEVRFHEPRMALTDEGDGLSFYRSLLSDYDQFLTAGGRVIFEIGASQGRAVVDLMEESGLIDVEIFQDINGRDRVVVGHKPHKSVH